MFIRPDLWPPNSPDLNPVNYQIMGRDAGSYVSDNSSRETWQTWGSTWLTVIANNVNHAINKLRKRLQACVL